MYYTRNIEKTISTLEKQFACITLYGARQVGKSTVVAHVLGDKLGVQLDIFPLDNWIPEGAQEHFDLIDAKIRDLSTWMRMNNPKLSSADLERVRTWSGNDPMMVYKEMESISTQEELSKLPS